MFAGGAAVVAKHVKAAGAEVSFSTVLGNDAAKDFVLKDLDEAGIDLTSHEALVSLLEEAEALLAQRLTEDGGA